MNRYAATVAAVLMALLALAGDLSAQVAGRMLGTVMDASGAAVPGASVSLLVPGGERPLINVITDSSGAFNFSNVRPALYDLTVELAGFQKSIIRGVNVDPARETVIPPIRLEVGAVSAEVAVVENIVNVQVSSAEISNTITNAQVQRLPNIDRNVLALITTLPGVTDGRGPAVINGLRTSFANVTLDGINIQDNFLRENGLSFNPNLLNIDQVGEMTVTTSNANATISGGAAHVAFVTPSGTNQFHGAAYWYNRNSAVAANDWFNNRDGIPNPFLNQNQVGGSIGGPIKKDRLFFYNNYEAFRLRQQRSQLRRVLTDDARRGIFTYVANGAVQKANILQLVGGSVDPVIQQLLSQVPTQAQINSFDTGDSSSLLFRNTAGYTFLQRDNRTRDNVTNKLDYHPSTKHSIFGSYIWNRDIVDRGDVNSTGYTVIPKVANDDATNFMSLGWRWSPSSTFTNELRGGFNLAPGVFATSEKFGSYLVATAGTIFSSPVNTFRGQGRDTNTHNYMDNASYWKGKHTIAFGFQTQRVRSAPYDDAGITPTYTLGAFGTNLGLSTGQLPGISSGDLATANNLLATLAGYVTSYSQTFNVTSRSSKFVDGAANRRHIRLDRYGYYLQDNWRTTRRLTTTLGFRYDYETPVTERDGLALLPQLVNNNPLATLFSNATLDFAGSGTGRPFYGKDRNNFAPNIGLAYDVFGDGKTALRAGYSVSYVDDQTLVGLYNNVNATNRGLSATSTASGLSGRLTGNLPAVAVPVYKVPRTLADNNAIDPTSAVGLPDPNLRTPYVQEWNISIQQDFKGTVFDVRYVGNHGTKEYRGYDFNQVIIRENGFLDDFRRAQNNGFLARAATGTFDPDYRPSIPGSQPLTVFPLLSSGGLLTNATVRGLILSGEPGELAYVYQTNRLAGDVNFFRNPATLGANLFMNASNSTYNALQIDVRRRMAHGFQFQSNYTYSKVLSDSVGDLQARFEAYLDSANPQLERARPNFDITHAFKSNGVWELPFGAGHRLNMADSGMSKLISGWSISGNLVWQSGGPFSILSGRGTVNRAGRSSATNTANSLLTKGQLDDLVRLRMSDTGPYIVAGSAIGPDGRAVAGDGGAPFSGQAFFNPTAGNNGTLQRRVFNGPSVSNLDFSITKETRIKENHSLLFRAEAANALNHPSFHVDADQNINSTNFGKITTTLYDRRVIQFSLHYKF